jgi:hypothetical protein
VLKYLARYINGGPISNSRIIRDENDRVSFLARSKNKAEGNRPAPLELSAKGFVRRWSMHILPKGYTKSRSFGGYHPSSNPVPLQSSWLLPQGVWSSVDTLSATCHHVRVVDKLRWFEPVSRSESA